MTSPSISYEGLLEHRRPEQQRSYDVAKVQLYGVGVGLGLDPLDPQHLQYLRDDNPKVLPAFAAVAAFDVEFKLELGVDWSKLIHASQRLRINQPLPPQADFAMRSRIHSAFDKPSIDATLLVARTEMLLGGEVIAELEGISLARDFRVRGAPSGSPEALPVAPERKPDTSVLTPTSAQVAFVYRLLGGRSLIHCDPEAAKTQGFERPIMHGLSTWGHACHAVVRGACDGDPDRLRAFAANFTAPVYPGETLRTDIWVDGDAIRFTTCAQERDVVVLGNGSAELASAV
jgi:acyl dehydratase